MIDLSKFCAKESCDGRKHLYAPWRDENGLVATNGHVLIVIPDNGGEFPGAPEAMAGKIAPMLSMVKRDLPWISLDDILLPDAKPCPECSGKGFLFSVECYECDGEGAFEHGSHTYECKACHGDGRINSHEGKRYDCPQCYGTGNDSQPISLGGSSFDRRYLALIKSLGSCHIAPDGYKPAAYKFSGGKGLLMPMRGEV